VSLAGPAVGRIRRLASRIFIQAEKRPCALARRIGDARKRRLQSIAREDWVLLSKGILVGGDGLEPPTLSV
jgi:hypothetical protein